MSFWQSGSSAPSAPSDLSSSVNKDKYSFDFMFEEEEKKDERGSDGGPSTFPGYALGSTNQYSGSPSDTQFAGSQPRPLLNYGALESISGARIAPAFGVGMDASGLDYLFTEDFYEYRKKSWGEQIQYLGGISYLTGALTGGTYGLYEALKSSRGKTAKLLLNATLNSVGKRASLMAQSMGVCALMFSGFESVIYSVRNDDQPENYALAGFLAGSLFRSTKGLKPAGICGAGLAAVGLGLVYGSRSGYLGREVQGLL